ETAATAFPILEPVVQPISDILAAALQLRAQHFRVPEHEIGGPDRVRELLAIKLDPAALLLVEPVHLCNGALHPVRSEQITLLDEIEDLVFLPIPIAEALVAADGRHRWLRLTAQHAARRALPQSHV